ncbi:DUF6474 family protein [Prescottella equi]|uniref:DUF6474 family protein n=1 Tax=Rhodococcus hoagii TaxID=43767 RepID=UPI000A0FCA59|nr:DUF6474 family protein [Prescottella equi]NKT45226.1 hypothetical protein [Prescottella equi]ORL78217.1 hypothetical protein A5905_15200 [Prescottella equi]ORM03571.1 hypothetical protein A5N72_15715 [Prescottella equi]
MGLFKKRKRRATRKAEAKALKHKAKLEAKLGAKNDRKKHRSYAKAQKKVDKAQISALKAQEKAAAKAAEKGLTVAQLRRYMGVARLLAPVVVPLAYRGATALRGQLDAQRAQRMGIAVDQLGEYTGHGAKLSARIAGAEKSVAEIVGRHPGDAETQQFATAIRARLTDLETAVHASEQMPPARRKQAHHAISSELDGVEADILARLGVR